MTSCHLHSETRIYCEFRENKSQAETVSMFTDYNNLRNTLNNAMHSDDILTRLK